MENIKMIVTDLDGTLLRNDKSISDYTSSVFKRCSEKGIKIVFATGRAERVAVHFGYMVPVDFIIGNNGATVNDKNECIRKIIIPKEIKDKLLRELAENKYITGIVAETESFLYTNCMDLSWATNADWRPVHSDFSEPIQEEVVKIVPECEREDIIRSIIAKYDELILIANRGENWYMIGKCGVDKFDSIKFVCERTGIDVKNVIAFGDDYNDVEMLKNCGFGVAVENAADKVKQAADYLCGSNENDGMAKFIEQNILKGR